MIMASPGLSKQPCAVRYSPEAAISAPPPVSGLKDWFAKYGTPGERIQNVTGLASEFRSNSKVYGGTKHHQAFKSLAVTLKRGALTR